MSKSTFYSSPSLVVLVACVLILVGTVPGFAQERAPVTIEFWHAWTGDRLPLMDEVFRRFEERYPWITVEGRLVPANSLQERTTLAVVADTAPDVVMMQYSQSTGLGLQGAFLPLDTFAEADGTRIEDYFFPSVSEMLLNNPLSKPGRFYYLPQTLDPSWFLYYNIPHLENAGLSTTNVPKTWTELEEYSRRLVQTGPDGEINRIGVDVAAHRKAISFIHWLGSAGGRRYSPDLKTVIMREPESKVLMTLEWVERFTREINGGIEVVDALHADHWTRFLEERASMTLIGAYNTFIAEERGMEIGMAGIPHPDGYEAKIPLTLGWGYGIPSNAKHPEEAWLLMKFLTLEVEGGGWFMLQQGRPGGTIEMNMQPEYADMNPYWHVIQDSFNRSSPGEMGPPVGGFEGIIGGMVRDVVYGHIGPRAAVERAHTLLEARLETYWGDFDDTMLP